MAERTVPTALGLALGFLLALTLGQTYQNAPGSTTEWTDPHNNLYVNGWLVSESYWNAPTVSVEVSLRCLDGDRATRRAYLDPSDGPRILVGADTVETDKCAGGQRYQLRRID